jgi:hypothetical protein
VVSRRPNRVYGGHTKQSEPAIKVRNQSDSKTSSCPRLHQGITVTVIGPLPLKQRYIQKIISVRGASG